MARLIEISITSDAVNSTTNTSDAALDDNATFVEDFDAPEVEHEENAYSSLALNVTIIGCLLLAYYVKANQIYYIPESVATLVAGMIIGGIARLATDDLQLFEFSPEIFFFVLLPPIIFEAGYSLNRKDFFDNIFAISLYAIFGTIISTFCVGLLVFHIAKNGLIQDIDQENPIEALLFGSLISAVDPVATLSILGNTDLHCDPLLYSLVFGESVLNDATSIVLFNTFHKYYNPDGPDWREAKVPNALLEFFVVFMLSILVGVALGLMASFIYKHTSLSDFPTLETSLLLCFCYLCYSVAEALELSGIMALFFNGVVLSHYNSYNLSSTAHVASEQIFSTLATVTETMVFLYMGMGVFTGRFRNWDVIFSLLCLSFCLLGRAFNIFPLSFLANCCRQRGRNKIPLKMQAVLWFAGLRGAIAFALSENMPGPNKETYVTTTLSICVFTTIVCGTSTEKILSWSGMRKLDGVGDGGALEDDVDVDDEEIEEDMAPLTSFPIARRVSGRVYSGVKGAWRDFDNHYLKRYFGGSNQVVRASCRNGVDNDGFHRGNFELTGQSSPRMTHFLEDDQFDEE